MHLYGLGWIGLYSVGNSVVVEGWTPTSWKSKTAYQMPAYRDMDEVDRVTGSLSTHAPLIFAGEADELKQKLHQVAIGNRFLITGGDCAEAFESFSSNKVKEDLQLLMQMSLICGFYSGLPMLQIGRMAGQYAKPRSSEYEIVGNKTYPVYRGDIVNDFEVRDRAPNPQRMMQAYSQSVQTLNLIRAFLQGGYTTIQNMKDWKFEKLSTSPTYLKTLAEIEQALVFLKSLLPPEEVKKLRLDQLYTGHECLLLPYESGLTRSDSRTGNYYGCSAHFLWLGERTRKIDAAQVEYLRGIHNPIGIKVSTLWDHDEMKKLLDCLDPYHEPGRITIITRMGHDKVTLYLPKLIHSIQSMDRQVVWCCDPMHGNTFSIHGHKTRSFEHVKKEIDSFFDIHRAMGTVPGGIHLEMTNRNVTECIGGNVDQIVLNDLSQSYESKCDPRLNGLQALEIAFFIGEKLRQRQRHP